MLQVFVCSLIVRLAQEMSNELYFFFFFAPFRILNQSEQKSAASKQTELFFASIASLSLLHPLSGNNKAKSQELKPPPKKKRRNDNNNKKKSGNNLIRTLDITSKTKHGSGGKFRRQKSTLNLFIYFLM